MKHLISIPPNKLRFTKFAFVDDKKLIVLTQSTLFSINLLDLTKTLLFASENMRYMQVSGDVIVIFRDNLRPDFRNSFIMLLDSSNYRIISELTSPVPLIPIRAFVQESYLLRSTHNDDKEWITEVYDLDTGKIEWVIPGYACLPEGLSPDGKNFAVSQTDRIEIWDIEKRTVDKVYAAVEPLICLTYSPSGRLLAGVLDDERIKIFDMNTAATRYILGEMGDGCSSPVFSPDDKYLASFCLWNCVIKVWDLTIGTLIRTIGVDATMITSISFSPDSTLLGFSTNDEKGRPTTIEIWEIP